MWQKKRFLKNNDGFTLVEFLLAAGIGFSVLAALAAFFVSTSRLHARQSEQNFLQQEIRTALLQMSYELRMAGLDPRGTGLFGFASFAGGCGENSVAFTLDTNENGYLNDTEYIGYRLQDKTVQRFSNKSSQPLSAKDGSLEMTDLDFVYRLSGGSETKNPVGKLHEITAVKIRLCGRLSGKFSSKKETEKYCLQVWVKIRNGIL